VTDWARRTRLVRKTPLRSGKGLERKVAAWAVPERARSTLHHQQADTQKLVKGRRHVWGIPPELANAVAEMNRRGRTPSADLINRAYWASSNYFRHLPDEDRLLLSCTVNSNDCWEWVGSLKENGYGQFRFRGKSGYAHRASYSMFNGPTPHDMTVDHQCQNLAGDCREGNACPHRRCVNPAHLELTGGVDNARRGVRARRTCPRGHDLEGNRKDLARCRRCLAQDVALQSDRIVINDLVDGKRKAKAKISDADIEAMREMKALGRPLVQIAGVFGITAKYASAVTSGSRTRRKRHPGPTPAVRRMVGRRSGGLCEFADCSREAIHQHHRRPRRMGSSMATESNLPANLVDLCLDHHGWVESYRAKALELGLLLHANAAPAEVPVFLRYGDVLLADDGSYSPTITDAEEATS